MVASGGSPNRFLASAGEIEPATRSTSSMSIPYGTVANRRGSPYWVKSARVASASNTTADAEANAAVAWLLTLGSIFPRRLKKNGRSTLSWIAHTAGRSSRAARSTPGKARNVFASTALNSAARAQAASSACLAS